MPDPVHKRRASRSLIIVLLGALFALIGVVLAVGGAWLAAIGGSLYYLLAGLGLVVSGWLLIRGRVAGVWLYLIIFALTILWALWEVGFEGWALVPRIVGPAVLAILAVLALPLLRPERWRWRGALAGTAGLLVLLIGGSVIIAASGRSSAGPLPASFAAPMADPALMQAGADWPAYGGTYSARRYSPLAQITPDNVARLERAWVFNTGELPEDRWGAETTPLKVGDSLYLCTGMGVMIALDPVTGRQRWRYDPQVPEEWIPYTAACRGVSYYAVPGAGPNSRCAARIIGGTLDGRIIAVDARTGRPCPNFGVNGQVDIKRGMGPVSPAMVSITSPPTIVRGVIVTGHQVLDGQRRDAPSGVIQGFDAVTGETRWAWDMVNPQWTGDPPAGQMYARGTPNMWTIASGDEQLGLVYLPMGNSTVDYWSSSRRPQENEFATSLVALDVTTGRPRWHFQAVHNDVWDYDFGGQASLVDFPVGQGVVPALVLPSKQGDIYILDRRTGRSLFPVQERPVPQGGVEPAQRSPTQPFSTYHTLAFPKLTERDMWGMSPIDQMVCRIQYRRAVYDGPYTPPRADRRSIQYPGYNGGTDWGGVAIDPVRGLIIANYNDMPNYVRLVPREEADRLGWAPRSEARGGDMGSGAEGAGDPQWGSPYAVDVNAGWRLPFTGLLCKEPPYGGIRAIDLRTGRTIWDRPLGTARRNGPWGIPSMLPINIGTPNNGGAVVTAGGLIFIAAATDDLIRAIDIRTGKTVWQDALPAGGQAGPMVYEANGRQYLVIMAGGHHFMETPIGDEVIAYALP
ncbi:membrane-bound PQQ-dependent dehydrogenase, glucose/quinate/shikimate family [Sphingosinicella humi]|uniref:Membrane-bound PQQ-dependent dehydrogenase, glucose/quinate/shikimate family n=1 Tax=Allosphingosinicella humi TaxID=2068657 RepID=A0A2U2J3Z9_9SPHN|nr:membrane-bound PQQ-dependent dehydrogenase, glucose/quinate/shikimate family [Sphingosinicella humi]PWG03042.1 membrane-bound PQQ-dependent dehydrogenase, glucose/quinate/shikimate family [Sphingosinicella humi]